MVDGRTAINLLHELVLIKFGKTVNQLIKANIAVTNFTRKTSISKAMIMLNVRVGSVDRITLFVVVTSKAGNNALRGREWIHGARVAPLTLHQKLIIWNDEGKVKEVYANDSPCYLQQAHTDFKVYNPKEKPLFLDYSTFNPDLIDECYFGPNVLYFRPKAEVGLAKKEM